MDTEQAMALGFSTGVLRRRVERGAPTEEQTKSTPYPISGVALPYKACGSPRCCCITP